jgi:hypothetical protein
MTLLTEPVRRASHRGRDLGAGVSALYRDRRPVQITGVPLWREIRTTKLPTQDPVTRSKHDSQKQKRPGDGRHHPGGAQ